MLFHLLAKMIVSLNIVRIKEAHNCNLQMNGLLFFITNPFFSVAYLFFVFFLFFHQNHSLPVCTKLIYSAQKGVFIKQIPFPSNGELCFKRFMLK